MDDDNVTIHDLLHMRDIVLAVLGLVLKAVCIHENKVVADGYS
jgi:hypothetical protein